ncbi:hypothetical protein VNO77_06452 [Canavalia gladiata]|uniref:Uncharacterized protein n=1 Tax=Canavalia gladiata TaxID=3824 RepID=A0AAN9M7L1_CANGL
MLTPTRDNLLKWNKPPRGVDRSDSSQQTGKVGSNYGLVWSIYCTARFGAVYKFYLYDSRKHLKYNVFMIVIKISSDIFVLYYTVL